LYSSAAAKVFLTEIFPLNLKNCKNVAGYRINFFGSATEIMSD
jgi:hypothetical protein